MTDPGKEMKANRQTACINELHNLVAKWSRRLTLPELLGILEIERTFIAVLAAVDGTPLAQKIQQKILTGDAIQQVLRSRRA